MAPSKGNCYLCGKTFGKTAIKNHIVKEHGNSGEDSVLLKVEGLYNKSYWLYLDMPKSGKLAGLDGFLRDIWLECCGHMSEFYLGRYNTIGKNTQIGRLGVGGGILYDYDMGSTTHLVVTPVAAIKRPESYGENIRLIARNVPPESSCAVCGGPAAYMCMECMYDFDGNAHLCDEHMETHEHDECMPISNSPRSGVCGYMGDSSYDFTGDTEKDTKTSNVKVIVGALGDEDEDEDDYDDDEDDDGYIF